MIATARRRLRFMLFSGARWMRAALTVLLANGNRSPADSARGTT